jgi:hypothetical protein
MGFTREREMHEMIDEITAIIAAGIALNMEARQAPCALAGVPAAPRS